MYRADPKHKVYDPTNSTEYDLASSIVSEAIRYSSPKIIYWQLNKEGTLRDVSETEDVYNERTGMKIFGEAKEIFGYVDVNPILAEISRLGIEQLEELNIDYNEMPKILKYKNLEQIQDYIKDKNFKALKFINKFEI